MEKQQPKVVKNYSPWPKGLKNSNKNVYNSIGWFKKKKPFIKGMFKAKPEL